MIPRTESQKKATAAAIRRIAEMTARYCTGQKRAQALEHLRRLDAQAQAARKGGE
ncbi:MAG: hypothetical protein JXA90_13535 [Planctomycetes bacterium]|nr:hypothetical protein [Planctomycetota bacterium]